MVSDVTVVDDFAGTASLISGDDGDDVLEVGEVWIYTVGYVVKATTPNPMVNTGLVVGKNLSSAVISTTVTQSMIITGYNPTLFVQKDGPGVANLGNTVIYTFTVSNLNVASFFLFDLDSARLGIASIGDGAPITITLVSDSVAGLAVYADGDIN